MDALIHTIEKKDRSNLDFSSAKTLLKDARHYQIIFLSVFYIYGVSFLGWLENAHFAFLAIITCLVMQTLFCQWLNLPMSALKSALISGFSIALMLKTSSVFPILLASIISISSKYFIRYNGKHVYNPTNFGIIVTILVTGEAWISPGQWGSKAFFLFFIGMAGLMVLIKAKRLDTGLIFIGIYSFLMYIRLVLIQGWEFDVFLHQLMSGTLLLFSFFMITDPATTPKSFKGRFVWTLLIATGAFAATSFYYINGAPLWSLFLLTPLSIVVNKIFPGQTFKWI